MTIEQADGYPWEVATLGTQTWAKVRCLGCAWTLQGKPDLEELAFSHVRQTGHTVLYDHGTTRGWTGLATIVGQKS